MKLNLILTAGLIVMAFTSTAQEEVKSVKNDIGFSVRIFNSPVAPFVLMYKRQLSIPLALRFGAAITVQAQRINFSDNQSSAIVSSSSFGPSVGVELQKHLGSTWAFYGGTDVRAALAWSRSEDYFNTQKTGETVTSSKSVIVSPFIGLRCAIIPQLYIATEASLNGSYTELSNTSRNFTSNLTGTAKTYTYAVSLQPAVGLFFFYRF